MIKITHKGSFKHAEKFLKTGSNRDYIKILKRYGEEGVAALREATPKDSGRTSESWSYQIEQSSEGVVIYWKNSNVNRGINIAMILQYGHGTGTGGYVEGIDYINPALKPVFDRLAREAWEVVTAP